MKANILVVIFLSTILFGFQSSTDKADATVERRDGLYVYIMAKPKSDNEYLGSVKKSLALTGEPEEMLNSMIKKVKKEYPQAEGIIFTTVAMDKADAIKFKP